MENRVYNFSAGPAVLPLPALEQAQRELTGLPGVGMSILEISHRSSTFIDVIEAAEANLRKLLNIPNNYKVLFLQGGAQLQFAMAPMNILCGTGKKADYILHGTWGKKAMQEASTQGECCVAWDGAETNNTRTPANDELNLNPDAGYVHMTSNETIQGVQFKTEPEVDNVPLVCDSSSDLLCRPLDISKYGILYACAQKNIGPAGVTIVIIRDDLIELSSSDLPSMLSYKVMAKGKSLYNTPPCFSIYMVKLITDWLLNDIGGLDKMYETNKNKAQLLYNVIDNSDGFYLGHAVPECRSLMNVPFKMATDALDKTFLDGAAAEGLVTLKGHRSVGGFRASIYNAMPTEGVEKLAQFMKDFQAKHV